MKITILLFTIFLISTQGLASDGKFKEIYTSTPQEVIHQYCKLWFNSDYKNMYKLLSKTVSINLDYKEFEKMKINEMVQIGLPKKCTIINKLGDNGNKSLWSVKISYENKVVGQVISKNWCEKFGRSWKLSEGGMIGGVLKNPFFN